MAYRITTPLYMFLKSLRFKPHTELPRLLIAEIVLVVLRRPSSICGFRRNVVSIIRPRYLHAGLADASPHTVPKGFSVLIFVRALVKCVSWNFSGAKADACVVDHLIALPSA